MRAVHRFTHALARSAGLLGATVIVAALAAAPAQAAPPAAPPGADQSTATFSSTATEAVPGFPSTGVARPLRSTITVSGVGTYLSDVQVFTKLFHTFPGDLRITLTSPGGTTVQMANRLGGGENDIYSATRWSDAAGVPVSRTTFSNTVAKPELSPQEGFSKLLGTDPNGTWTLTVTDLGIDDDTGVLKGWSLDVSTLAEAPTLTTRHFDSGGASTAIAAAPITRTVHVFASQVPSGTAWIPRVTTQLATQARGALKVTLTSPAGRVVKLIDNDLPGAGPSQSKNPYLGTMFDDRFASLVTDLVPSGDQPLTRVIPTEPLGAFRGESPVGTWTLTVSDARATLGDRLDGWSLDLVTAATLNPPKAPPLCSPTTRTFTKDIPGGQLVNFGAVTGNDSDWTQSSLTVSGAQPYLHDVQVLTRVTTPAAAKLRLQLVAPDGRTVWLARDDGRTTGGPGDQESSFDGTLFADDADTVVGTAPVALADFPDDGAVSPVAPRQPLSRLVGMDPNGSWTLRAFDTRSGSRVLGRSVINGFTLKLTTFAQAVNREKTLVSTGPQGTRSGALTLPFTVAGAGTVLDQVDLELDAPDLPPKVFLSLSDPSGGFFRPDVSLNQPTAQVASDPSLQLFDDVTFSDSATKSITGELRLDAGPDQPQVPVQGQRYSPLEPLAAFRGINPNGVWELHVVSALGQSNTLIVKGAALTIRTASCADTTPPTNPTVTSPSHTPGVTSADPDLDITTAGATDNVGVDGFSWVLDHDPGTTPDTTKDGLTPTMPFHGLADGTWYFHLRTVDAAGNWSDPVHFGPVIIDTLLPDTTIATGPTGVTGPKPTFTFTANKAPVTYECALDLGAYAACDTPYTTPALADGPHVLNVVAKDSLGRVDATPATRSFTVDATLPDTTITGGPGGLTRSLTPSWTFTATKTGSTFRCAVDDGAPASCTSPFTAPTLTNGQHTFSVYATDPVGNDDPTPDTRSITVDAIAPDTTFTSGPADGASINTAPTFGLGADEPSATFECKVDAGAYAACTSPFSTGPLAAGSHTISARATDPAGNVDPTPVTRTITIDTTPPDTSFTAGPSGPTASTQPVETLSATEPGSTFECAVDLGLFAPCTSPWTTPVLGDGQHTLYARATDPAGNVDPTPASRSVTVDATAPDTTLGATPTGTTGASPTFTFSSPDAGATFECSVDSGAYAACTSPKTLGPLSGGAHRIDVRAVDAVGNRDATPAGRAFTVDVTPPNTTFTSGPADGATVNAAPSFGLGADESPVTFQCKVDAGTYAACTSPFSTGPLAAGSHTISARAIDAVGNVDPTPVTRTITIDTTPPNTAFDGSPGDLIATDQPVLDLTSTEPGSTFECAVDLGPFAPCTTPWTTPSLGDGDHILSVRATDAAGNTDPTPDSLALTVDTTAPDTALGATPTGTTGPSPQFTFTSPDSGASFECSVDSGSYATCTSPVTLGPLAGGAHRIDVRAVDAAGNADATPAGRAFTVDATGPVTRITGTPAVNRSTSKAQVAFTSDDPAATYECNVDSGAYVACTSPWTTAALADGPHTAHVRGTDAYGNTGAAAAGAFVVDTVVPDTTIDSGPPATIATTSATFQFSSSEAGVTFECNIDSEVFYVPCTSPRTLSALGEGDHTFRVRARDAAGNVDATPAARTFIVDTIAPQTTIDSGPDTTSGATAIFSFSSDPGATFRCSLDGAPATACTSPRTYPGLTAGPHTFSVVATDAAGNTDPTPATRSFTADLSLPTARITSGPAMDSAIATATPDFAFTADRPGSTFLCAFDSDPLAACASPFRPRALIEGVRTFWVVAVDTHGNQSARDRRTFTVDLTPPVTKVVKAPAGTSVTGSVSGEAGSSEPGTFECNIDGGAWFVCDTTWITPTMANGVHRIGVRAVDGAGNRDATPTYFDVTVAVPAQPITPLPPVTEDISNSIGLANPTSATPSLTYTGAPLTVTRRSVTVGLRCPAGETRPCPAGFSVTVLSPSRLRGRRLASFTGSVQQARTTYLRAALSRRNRRALAPLSSIRVRLAVTLDTVDGKPAADSWDRTVRIGG